MKYRLSQIAQICGGRLHGEDRTVSEVLTDSRHSGGDRTALFVAIEGANHNSHLYIEQMKRRGVESFLVEDNRYVSADASFVVVDRSLRALQLLAADNRSRFKGKVVGITGSNGKTTVKEWIAQTLPADVKLFRSPKSYNSQLGVALSLLMLEGDEALVLIEAGISRPQEMERLSEMIRPDVAIITSIGDAHQEGFSSIEEKINEKLLLASSAETIIYHSDYTALAEAFAGASVCAGVVDASLYDGALTDDVASKRNSQIVECFAAVSGYTKPNFESLQPVAMRQEVKEGLNDSIIINDSYNSDINSLTIALDNLNLVAANRKTTLVLSPILQSGMSQEELYTKVAQRVERAGVDKLIGVGEEIRQYGNLFSCKCEFYPSTEELLRSLNRVDFAGRALLLKGNRESRFERISHLLERKCHITRLEVDLDAMVQNLNKFRSKLSPSTKLTAMVKASSYGAGDFEIAQLLQNEGVDYLAVAFADEGIELRERGITMPIIVLNADDGSFAQMIQSNLEPEIYSLYSLRNFMDELSSYGESSYPIHLKLDTGMHRLGFTEDQLPEFLEVVNDSRIRVASIFTHLCCADMESGEEFTLGQVSLFEKMCSEIKSRLDYTPLCHCAASAAIIKYPMAHADMCRLGIGLYGFGECDEPLQPISTLKSRIVQIKHLTKGESVGYGRATVLERDSVIATIPIGYADGLDRHLGCGKWSMIVRGAKAPILGRVCMDSSMIDITDIDGAREGDDVVIFSPQEGNTAEDMANILGTIPYEVLTSVSKRVKRIYLKE